MFCVGAASEARVWNCVEEEEAPLRWIGFGSLDVKSQAANAEVPLPARTPAENRGDGRNGVGASEPPSEPDDRLRLCPSVLPSRQIRAKEPMCG